MTIHIRPVTAIIGAEISGFDLREPLTDGDVAAIRQAWRPVADYTDRRVMRRVTIAGPPAR